MIAPTAPISSSSAQPRVSKSSAGLRLRTCDGLTIPTAVPTRRPASSTVAFSATAVTVAPLMPSMATYPGVGRSLIRIRSRTSLPTYWSTKVWITSSERPISTIGSECRTIRTPVNLPCGSIPTRVFMVLPE